MKRILSLYFGEKLLMNINFLLHHNFNVADAGNIYNTIKDKDWVRDNNLSCFTFVGTQSERVNTILCKL